VPGHDLSSIQGLEDKHLRALARQHITDLRGLVRADPEVIYRAMAMANLRPRPSRDQIVRWQDDARNMLGDPVPDASEWQTAVSFVIVFSQRQAGDVWEHRVEAEQTEVEPERNAQVWPGWECEPVCSWMLGQLGQADSARLASGNGTADTATQPAGESAAAAEPPPASPAAQRPALHIDTATIIDLTGRVDVLTGGAVAEGLRTELVAPVRLVFTVSGASPQTRLQAVSRILRRDGPGRNAHDPVVVPSSGQVEFDLSRVPAGEHEMSLIAWAPDAAAKPVSVKLPKVTIRSG
jgi:hypothetical protein